jgi:hypothetical protein
MHRYKGVGFFHLLKIQIGGVRGYFKPIAIVEQMHVRYERSEY